MRIPSRLVATVAAGSLVAGLTGCAIDITTTGSGIDGSGDIATQTYEPTGFATVALLGEGAVSIVFGELPRVSVTTDDNLLEHIEVRSDGATLFLGTEDGVDIDPTNGVEWIVTTPSLTAVSLQGAGDIAVPPLSIEVFEATLSGAGSIRLADIVAEDLEIVLTGAGEISATGSADRLSVRIPGAGDYEGLELVSRIATVDVSGAGDARVHATESLDADVSGAGSVRYAGGASVTPRVTGVGSIEPVD